MEKLKEAILWDKQEGGEVSCHLCCHRCKISEGQYGICGVRQNINGTLFTRVYGKVIATNIDPIEKKPIFHMLPGSASYSIATIGCNFRCDFCQNWQISQVKEAIELTSVEMTPEDIVGKAKLNDCPSISYTYTEPTIYFEFALDVMKLAKKENIYNIFVTNGFMTPECLEVAKPYLNAANVDLKSFSDEFYHKVCGGRLDSVLESIMLMRKLNIWVEITTLVIPGLNDSRSELEKIAFFIAGVDKNMPWHISRFHPDYKMAGRNATGKTKLDEAFKIGKDAGLRYVYLGNVPEEENTYCYNCNELLIRRAGFRVLENKLKNAACPKCSSAIDGLWIN
ncbi:MAG: AmmeMemoRadiSam system radical SAM enzyme [Candidatus Omnitrophica bacterium]|nr:AmmeMemoRadiSam system radical SAM enzyme [Candidatus Omnitrophota bacterium]